MGILDRISKEEFERRAGRLHFSPNCWVYQYSEAQYKKMVERNPRLYAAKKGKLLSTKDANGEEVYCIHQRQVYCRNAGLCEGKGYVQFEDKLGSKWCYPAKDCKKCEYYRPAERRGHYRFPRCMYRSSQKPGEDALKETIGVLNQAMQEAKKIVKEAHNANGSVQG